MFSVRFTRVREEGPFFDNRVHRAFDDFTDGFEEEAAEWAERHIKRTYHREFKHPTGFYESNVRIHNVAGGAEVWDGGRAGPVYGPWLEGIGSRNFPVTRFKGYHAFRKAATALERRIEELGHQTLVRYINRMS